MLLANQLEYQIATNYLDNKKKQNPGKYGHWDFSTMKPMDSILYVNKEITPGSSVSLLTGKTTEIEGACNYDGNRLAKDRMFIANSVSFGWAFVDKNVDVSMVEYDYKTLPAFLNYAKLVMIQGSEKLIDMSLSDINNNLQNGSNYSKLGAIVFVEDHTLIKKTLDFPENIDVDNLVPDGEKLVISVNLKGFVTYVKR